MYFAHRKPCTYRDQTVHTVGLDGSTQSFMSIWNWKMLLLGDRIFAPLMGWALRSVISRVKRREGFGYKDIQTDKEEAT